MGPCDAAVGTVKGGGGYGNADTRLVLKSLSPPSWKQADHLIVLFPPCSPTPKRGSDRRNHRHRDLGRHHLFPVSGVHALLLEEQEQIRRGGDPQRDQVGLCAVVPVHWMVADMTLWRVDLCSLSSLFQKAIRCSLIFPTRERLAGPQNSHKELVRKKANWIYSLENSA